jgi:hypothetical protein
MVRFARNWCGRTQPDGRPKGQPYLACLAVSRIQDRYNLSVPSVFFRNLALPTVPQSQRDTLIHIPSQTVGRGFESLQAYHVFKDLAVALDLASHLRAKAGLLATLPSSSPVPASLPVVVARWRPRPPSVALVRGTLLCRGDFARRVGASGARPKAERRSALRVDCGYAAL